MGLANFAYNTIFKRTSTFALVCVAAAFAFERSLDLGAERIFERINQGVSYIIQQNQSLLNFNFYRNYGKTSNRIMKATKIKQNN